MIRVEDVVVHSEEVEEDNVDVGVLSTSTLEASTKVLRVLNSMLDGLGENGTVNIADLKDITAMIKDVSAQIEKLSKSSSSSTKSSEGLLMFLNRLKR